MTKENFEMEIGKVKQIVIRDRYTRQSLDKLLRKKEYKLAVTKKIINLIMCLSQVSKKTINLYKNFYFLLASRSHHRNHWFYLICFSVCNISYNILLEIRVS